MDDRHPFATIADLEARWHALTSEETAKAQVLIGDATDMIMGECPNWRQVHDETLTRICCQMVKRAMIAETSHATGLSQYSQTAGAFTESGTFANPNGDLYLLAAEKRSLHGGQQGFHILMAGAGR